MLSFEMRLIVFNSSSLWFKAIQRSTKRTQVINMFHVILYSEIINLLSLHELLRSLKASLNEVRFNTSDLSNVSFENPATVKLHH